MPFMLTDSWRKTQCRQAPSFFGLVCSRVATWDLVKKGGSQSPTPDTLGSMVRHLKALSFEGWKRIWKREPSQGLWQHHWESAFLLVTKGTALAAASHRHCTLRACYERVPPHQLGLRQFSSVSLSAGIFLIFADSKIYHFASKGIVVYFQILITLSELLVFIFYKWKFLSVVFCISSQLEILSLFLCCFSSDKWRMGSSSDSGCGFYSKLGAGLNSSRAEARGWLLQSSRAWEYTENPGPDLRTAVWQVKTSAALSPSTLKVCALIDNCPMVGHLLHHQVKEKPEWDLILQRAAWK